MKRPRRDDAPRPSLRDAKPVLLRVGTALAVAVGFLWVTSQVDPEPTTAGYERSPRTELSKSEIPASLGTFEGREHTLRAIATPDGPRYTVTDAGGVVLADGLTEQQVYERFPELKLETMTAGPLMLAPQDR